MPVDINFIYYLQNPVSPTIVLNPLLPAEILNVMNSLKSFKACGYDNIPAHFLKLGGEVLANVL